MKQRRSIRIIQSQHIKTLSLKLLVLFHLHKFVDRHVGNFHGRELKIFRRGELQLHAVHTDFSGRVS